MAQAARSSKLTRGAVRSLVQALQGSEVTKLASLAGRKEIGIVFVDVVDFTGFTSRYGDGAATDALARLEEQISTAVAVGKGEIVKALGDGFLIAFPSASQAVRAAVRLASTTARRTYRLPHIDHPVRLRLRIGVHSGSPIVGANDLIGHDVNITSRLLDHCRPGQVVVSDAARRSAERRLRKIRFEHLASVELRGLENRYPIYAARPVEDALRFSA